jgi:hypothetical protein
MGTAQAPVAGNAEVKSLFSVGTPLLAASMAIVSGVSQAFQ